ncbi:hypothetical protein ACFVIY_26700 [Streptomyces sp. NPDC127166]|uniref:hypothetical protein n=1 Tax=Streptomyces sp. NPDC127166 TaxID=3345380 RepID=UPI00363AA705
MSEGRISRHLSVEQAKHLMVVVSKSDSDAISRGLDALRYGDEGALDGHPLAERGSQGVASLLRTVAGCVSGTPMAAHIVRLAMDAKALADTNPQASCLLASYALHPVEDLWRDANTINDLELDQVARSHGHPHRLRMLRSAKVPLWALEELRVMPPETLWAITPETLVDLAEVSELQGFGRDDLVAQAAGILCLLRILSVLAAAPSDVIELLQLLDLSNDEATVLPALYLQRERVPARACRPPGALVLAQPQVPRAPGRAVPRRPNVEGRCRLRQRGGRLIA